MIVLLPNFFLGFKTIVWFICPATNLRFKVKCFCAKLSSLRSLSTPKLQGTFRSSCCFFYFKSHTYNCTFNGQRALTSPKLGTRTIVLGRREYLRFSSIHFQLRRPFTLCSCRNSVALRSQYLRVQGTWGQVPETDHRGCVENTTICYN